MKKETTKTKNWGGKRNNSGRKPDIEKIELENIKEKISQHGITNDEKEKKERILVLLDKLFEKGKEGNIKAIKEYFDRQLGKSKETKDINLTEKSLLKKIEELDD